MNVFEKIVFSFIIILFPILCYLFYVANNRSIDNKRKDLVLGFALMNMFYFIIKYICSINFFYGLLLLTIPIFISIKKEYYIMFCLFLLLDIYLALTVNLVFIIYPILILISTLLINREHKLYKFLIVTVFIYLSIGVKENVYNLFYIVLYLIECNLTLYTITKGEDVINYHIEYKRLKHDSQFRDSLFKITHEIKNPLAVCKAYVDMFNYDDPGCSKRYIPIISSEIDKLLILLQDFLLVNKNNINFDIMDLCLLISDVRNNLKEINGFDIECFNIDDELYINGDYNRLTQVLTNMIKNSFEANANYVKIKLEVLDKKAIIYLIDNGDGINSDIKNKILEPFYTTKINGTGLGVPLSKEIMEAHNGELILENNKDKGVCTMLILPLLDI